MKTTASRVATNNLRSSIMRAVKSRNTTPELAVRKLLRPRYPGYRLHRADMPGKPDLAYVGKKVAIFVHGCFWHGHDCPRGARVPKTNTAYWLAKIERNRARDQRARSELESQGWSTVTIWECELKQPDRILRKVARALQ